MAIVGLLLGVLLCLLAAGIMLGIVLKVFQLLFLVAIRLVLCVFWNVAVFVSIMVMIGIILVSGDQAPPLLLLLASLLGFAVAFLFLKSMLHELVDFFRQRKKGEAANGNQT